MIITTLPMRDGEPLTYTTEHHNMTAAQIWAAWKAGEIAVFHMIQWQTRHGGYFTNYGTFHRYEEENWPCSH